MMKSGGSRRIAPWLLLAALVGCGGGGARSPDLPSATLKRFEVRCDPAGPIAVNRTAVCAISNCVYDAISADGQKVEQPGECPAPHWDTEPAQIASINPQGRLRALSAGQVTVIAAARGVSKGIKLDVYAPELLSAVAQCERTQLYVGQTSQCHLNQCEFQYHDGVESGPCPEAQWGLTPGSAGTISEAGLYQAEQPGKATVEATVGTLSPKPAQELTVDPACIQSLPLQLTPANAEEVAGQPVPFKALATFSDGQLGEVTETTRFVSDSGVVDFSPGGEGDATARTPAALDVVTMARITATVAKNTCEGAPVTGTTQLTVKPQELSALCLESADSAFEGCRAPTASTCQTGPLQLPVSGEHPLQLRALFKNSSHEVVRECNLTRAEGSSFTAANSKLVSVSETGLLTALDLGTTEVRGAAVLRGQTVPSTVMPVTVKADRLGNDSLTVYAKGLDRGQRKFACVGATDVAAGLLDPTRLTGKQYLYADARFCSELKNGSCDPATLLPTREVTNDDGGVNRMQWKAQRGYWDGKACVTTLTTNPLATDASPAWVGDKEANGPRDVNDNGVVVAAGHLRVGFSCVTAQYTSPAYAQDKDADGMTVLVLPVTNDVLLGPTEAENATEFCDALEPLFEKVVSANGADITAVRLLSAVTEVVDAGLGRQPEAVNQALNTAWQSLAGLSPPDPAVEPLREGLAALHDSTLYRSVTCGLRGLLNAIATQTAPVVSCEAAP